MPAIVFHNYGSPDVLKLEEVQKPVPQDDQVLVKVAAATTAAGDWHLLRADLSRSGFGAYAEYVAGPESALALPKV